MNNKVLIVLPAYNAEKTLERTFLDIPKQYQKNVLLVDDASNDQTSFIAKKLGIKLFIHKKNLGYGGNQKTCFTQALKSNPDIIILLHPDYQYPPKMVVPMIEMINTGYYDCVLGSRILVRAALKGKMPLYKYIFNRILTMIENILTGAKLSEYHTGLRAYKSSVLKKINFMKNSNSFIFDNQIILQILAKNFRIGEISTPCQYFSEASSINWFNSIKYGFGCIYWGFIYLLKRLKIFKHSILK